MGTKFAKTNLNNYIKFTPTEKARELYVIHMKLDVPEQYHSYIKPLIGADGRATLQMWKFMKIYGPYMMMGTEEIIDMNVEIEIEVTK